MAHDRSRQVDWKGLALRVDAVIDAAGNEVDVSTLKGAASIGDIAVLTGSSGGTANNVVESVPAATAATTDTSAASLTSTNAAITAIKNDIADLQAKINAIINAV